MYTFRAGARPEIQFSMAETRGNFAATHAQTIRLRHDRDVDFLVIKLIGVESVGVIVRLRIESVTGGRQLGDNFYAARFRSMRLAFHRHPDESYLPAWLELAMPNQ